MQINHRLLTLLVTVATGVNANAAEMSSRIANVCGRSFAHAIPSGPLDHTRIHYLSWGKSSITLREGMLELKYQPKLLQCDAQSGQWHAYTPAADDLSRLFVWFKPSGVFHQRIAFKDKNALAHRMRLSQLVKQSEWNDYLEGAPAKIKLHVVYISDFENCAVVKSPDLSDILKRSCSYAFDIDLIVQNNEIVSQGPIVDSEIYLNDVTHRNSQFINPNW